MKQFLEREFLEQETERVLLALTDQKFIDTVVAFKAKKGQSRLDFAKENFNFAAVKNKGVNLPDDLRLSARSFENDPVNESFVDKAAGNKIIDGLYRNRPDLLQKLKADDPTIFDSLKPYLPPGMSGGGEAPKAGNPDPAQVKSSGNGPEQPLISGACGCGGAFTVCAGGGYQK